MTEDRLGQREIEWDFRAANCPGGIGKEKRWPLNLNDCFAEFLLDSLRHEPFGGLDAEVFSTIQVRN